MEQTSLASPFAAHANPADIRRYTTEFYVPKGHAAAKAHQRISRTLLVLGDDGTEAKQHIVNIVDWLLSAFDERSSDITERT